jgi:peptidoglycan/LPS O-acetylase OafA/YrhL
MTSPQRNFGLDLLRALAIVSVFFGHGVTALERLTIGVELFFVLSGFLIGRIYFRSRVQGTFSLGEFWVSRWWRTLPPYLAALAVILVAEHWIPTNPLNWHYLFFLQTFTGLQGFGPSWSLCVEEHFYLALPLLGLAAEKLFGRKQFIWLLPVAFVVPALLRFSSFLLVGGVANMPHEWFRLTPYHCDGLIAGVFLAYLYVEHPARFWDSRKLALFCAPLVLVSFLLTPRLQGQFAFEALHGTFEALGFAACLRLGISLKWESPSILGSSRLGSATKWFVQWAALTSYSVYLLHTLLMSDLHVLLDGWTRGVGKTVFILVVTIAVCVLFYFLVERPSIQTRDQFLKEHLKRGTFRFFGKRPYPYANTTAAPE